MCSWISSEIKEFAKHGSGIAFLARSCDECMSSWVGSASFHLGAQPRLIEVRGMSHIIQRSGYGVGQWTWVGGM